MVHTGTVQFGLAESFVQSLEFSIMTKDYPEITQMIDQSDKYLCVCPTCGDTSTVSGDKMDEAHNETVGVLTLHCGHGVHLPKR
jgi:hypothetical protein